LLPFVNTGTRPDSGAVDPGEKPFELSRGPTTGPYSRRGARASDFRYSAARAAVIGSVNTIAFSPDGKIMASGGEIGESLGEVLLWRR
jgi:hypothetical protein